MGSRTYSIRAPAAFPSAVAVLLVPVLFGVLLPSPGAGEEARPAALQIALSATVMRDVPEAMFRTASRPMLALIEGQTKIKAELSIVADADSLADRLVNGKTSLGVFQGCEFAWVREQHSKLSTLVVAVNQKHHLHALVIVRHDSTLRSFSDLEDRPVTLPRGNRDHCRLFCERHCRVCGETPEQFFGKIERPASVEESLDDVVDGAVEAAIVDAVALECYQRRKPGRSSQLKELLKSETFPATVIAYQAGSLDEGSLRRIRDSLLAAKQTVAGRQAMLLWRITGFEPVPKDYEETLASIVKVYPRPTKGK